MWKWHIGHNYSAEHTFFYPDFGLQYLIIYIRTSKPKLMALNSIHFSFSRNKYLVTECGYCLNLYKNRHVLQGKRAKQT